MDVTAVARYQAEMDSLNKTIPEGVLAAKKLTDNHIKLKGVLSEGNAAMRGFTQGLGTMSAGMYSMLPFMASFLAGAAVMKTLKVGAEFQTSMFVIGELAGNSQESMVKLKDSVLALADTTQYGPLELAKGLETLTLAGLSATAAMQGLQPTLQFASATGMPVEKAAETLVAVQTAYKFTIDGFATIGDLIAKTAADTMSSGASMAEAFRTASVVAQQYKLTLEDTAVTLGMLANIGIQGGAAGTSYRNMITELNKGSGKAAEGIKALGAEVQNLDGSTRHIMDVMKDLSTGLITKTGAAQQRLLQDMTNERGAKAMAAFQSQMLTFLNTSNPQLQEQANALFKIGDVLGGNKLLTDAVTEAYDKMKTKMEESVNSAAAFTFFADLEKRLTASAQFAGIGASLEKAFVETFEKVGDSAYILGERIRGVFKSEEFNGALVSLANGVLTLTKAFFDLGDWLASNSTALSIITAIFGTAAAIFLGPVGVVAGLTAGTVALQHLIDKFEVFNSVADKAAADEKKRLETSIKANELKIADSNKQIDTQIESQIKLLAKLRDKDKVEEDGIKIAGEAHMARIKQLYAQQREMVDLIRLQYILNEMQAKGKDANIVEIASSSAKMADTLKSGITKAEHDALDKAEVNMYQALYLAKQISALTKENAAKANTNPYGVDKKGGYTGSGKPAFVERLVLKQDNETETNLKFYNTELTSLANHEANKRKILEASRSNKLISEATFAGESLALTEKAEAAELALISAAQTKRAIDLGNDISKVRSQADAAMAKGAKEVEVTKTVNAAIADLGNKAATDMQTLQARADKARETADTRTKISRDKQIAGLKELDRESAKFWTDEAIRQAKASSSVALEDSLRYASPEAAARISAMATEQDYWNDKIREQEVAVKAAGKELLDYQATLVATENGTKDAVAEEEHYVAVLKKKAEALAKLKGYSVNAVDKAGENALIKLNKDNQQKLVEDVAGAIETGLLQGGEAGKAKLRDILQVELMKPIRLMIQAFVNPVMGAVSGALGLNGMGSGGGGLLSGMSNVLGMGKTLSSVGSTLGNIGSSVAGFFGGGSALGGGLATAATAPVTGLGMTLGSGLSIGTGTGLSLTGGMSSGLGLTAGASTLGAGASTLGAGLVSNLAVGGGAAVAGGGGLASLGMLGPIGLGIGALALLSGMGGGFKSSGPTGDTQNVYSANGSLLDSKTWGGQSTLSNNTSNYMYEKYSALADTLGVGKVATNFRYGGNTGAQGENPNFAIGGGTGAFQYSQGETAVSDQNLALATSRAVFTALQGSVLPDYVARLLSTVDVSSASLDQLNAIATAAMEVKAKNQGLQDRLDLMTGKTTQLELDLRDTQDESTKSLIRQIYAQEALTKAAEETKAAWESLTNTLLDEIKRIRTNMVTGPTQTFAGAQTAFTLGTAQARAGDQKAIASLPGLSQALLKLAESNSVTSAEFMGWQARTATSLEQTYGGLSVPSFDVGTNRVPQDMLAMVHKGEAIIPAAYNPANGGSGDEQVASLLREVIARLDSLDYGTRAIATHTSKSAKILDRVTPTGNSIQTTAVTP
jgi:TP901 family phage tail tape measure protein